MGGGRGCERGGRRGKWPNGQKGAGAAGADARADDAAACGEHRAARFKRGRMKTAMGIRGRGLVGIHEFYLHLGPEHACGPGAAVPAVSARGR